MDTTTNANATRYLSWNSRGVADLELGRYDSAVDTFRKALGEMRSRLDGSSNGQPLPDPQTPEKSSSSEAETEITTCQHSVPEEESENSEIVVDLIDDELRCVPALESVPIQPLTWESPRNLFDFYSRAFKLAELSENAVDYTRPLVVLLYNLALTHHTRSDSASLAQAARLYKSAMDIMSNSWNKDDFEEMQCLLLAVANNLGHLQSHLMNFHETRECLNLVLNLISYPTDEFQVSEEDFTLFYDSVYAFLDAPELSLAPAA